MTVVSLNGNPAVQSLQSRAGEGIGHTIDLWSKAEGLSPTAAFWAVCDDDGTYRTGWDCESSALPASALRGIMIAAIIRGD